MTTAIIWGTLTVLFCLGVIVTLAKIETTEPAGHHHKPSRRQRDRAYEAETVRVYKQIRDELVAELAAVAAYVADTPTVLEPELAHYDDPAVMAHASVTVADWPLMPLPPEVGHCGWDWAALAEEAVPPEDPHDVLGDEGQADAYVGPVQPACRSGLGHGYDRCPTCSVCRACRPHDVCTPGPDDHLREGQYAEATGQFTRALLDDYERAHAGGA